MLGSAKPTVQDESLVRSKDPIGLFNQFAVVDTSAHASEAVECAAFRKFGLFLDIDSTGTPTTLQVKVEFLDRWTGKWHQYAQGPFASLFYEDADSASGLRDALVGDCLGRAIRVTLTGVGTTSSAYFTVSVSVELWN